MDFVNDLSLAFIQIYTHLKPFTSPLISILNDLRAQLTPILYPLLNRLLISAHEYPAIIVVGAFIFFVLVALQVLMWVQSVMMFWYRLVMRVAFWGVLAVVVGVVAKRGVGRTVEDLGVLFEGVKGVWWREYERWDGASREGYGKTKPAWGHR